MSAHAEATHEPTHGASNRLVIGVWVTLVAITIVEVYLAYLQSTIHFSAATMLIMLIGLSVLKAALIMAYFMHLRFERFTLFLTLIPVTLFCIGMMTVIFPDSLRLLQIRLMQ
ncbi:MAG TPA: cytochrome C oxidase subunit IV family protein [Candidatus Acidoferrales bacterium]|nr:cytochrome C oxidase subunit IV family protein [Candidatus Acidoferrales bacterium]